MATRETTIRLTVKDNFSAQLRQFAAALDASEKSALRLQATASSGFARIGDAARRLGSGMARIGNEITTGLTLPLVGIGVAAGKMSMDFETSMSRIVGLVGVSQDQVDAWSKELLQLGPALGKSPRELAEALYFVTSSGIKGAQALEVLTVSAKAASAGLGQTQTVADAVTSAMNAYARSGLDAEHATGILIAAVREGKGEASEFAGSIGRVIPVAAQLGISFDQVAAAMAAQTLVGFDAAEAATNLSGILSALLKPTKQAKDTLSEYGLSMDDLRAKAGREGLLPVLMDLSNTIGDNDEALAAIFPNIRGFRGLLSLVGENADKSNKIFASLAKTTGQDLTNAFAAAEKTAGFKFKQAMAGVQVALIQLGDDILPPLMPLIKGLAETLGSVVKAFTSLPQPIQQAVVQALAFGAALGPILRIGGGLVSLFGGLISGFGKLAGLLVSGAQAAGSFAKTGFEAVQYLTQAGAITPMLIGKLGLLGAGLVVVAKYLEQVAVAGRATNDELLKMSKSGDLFEQAAASTEIMANGSKRLRDVFIEHQTEMRQKLEAGQVSLEEYNAEIERSARVAGVWREELHVGTGTVEVIDEAVQILTEDQYEFAKSLDEVNARMQAQNVERLRLEYPEVSKAADELTDSTKNLTSSQWEVNRVTPLTREEMEKLAEAFRDAREAAADSIDTYYETAAAIVGMTNADLAATALGNLRQAMIDGRISEEEYNEQAGLIAETYGGVTKQGLLMTDTLDEITGLMQAGYLPASEYAKAVQLIDDAAKDGKINIGELGQAVLDAQVKAGDAIDAHERHARALERGAAAARGLGDAIRSIPLYTEITTRYHIVTERTEEGSPTGGGRQHGGSIFGGVPYMVGERGPEIVVPGMAGSVFSSPQSAEMLTLLGAILAALKQSGRGSNYNLTVNTSAGINPSQEFGMMRALAGAT